MTRKTNARIAGVTLLLYIVVGIVQMIVTAPAGRGDGPAARLASMAAHAANVRAGVLLGLLTSFVALTLGVALYALTREQDSDIALIALACRIAEGVFGAVFIPMTLGLLSLATAPTTAAASDPALGQITAFFLAARRFNPLIAATFFAVGSTLFSWLLLRGRMIPAVLAWLGVAASVLLVIALPMQLTAFLTGAATQWIWLPMAVFEIALAVWLMIRGAALPAPARVA